MSSEASNPRHPPAMTPSASAPAPAPAAGPLATKRRRLIALAVGVGVLGAGALWIARSSGRQQAAHTPRPVTEMPRVDGQRIIFSRAFVERSGVKFVSVSQSSLVPVVTAVGTVAFNPAHVAAVGARLRGLVSRVTKFEGDTVDSGTVLAVIDSGELGEAQASVSMLEAEKRASDVNYQRETALAQKNLTTQREAEMAAVQAERSRLMLGAAKQKVAALTGGVGSRSSGPRLGAHELRSPMKGMIVERLIAPGQTVEGQMVAFRIANVDHLWVELDVFERSLSKIRVGDRVELSPLAAPKDVFEGRVALVGAVIDPETRSAPIRIEVDNRDRRLRAGQAVNSRIHATGGGEQVSTIVPTSAITLVDGRPTLFVKSGENAVRIVKVELGVSDADETEVLGGVKPGEEVVSEGVFALKSELFR
ncbi:MAG TPA: efflux RND transporter periplasmic adaptor subunit [Polyangiaceae bacterium]|nr:efflux RND transporter periplasmic adaptor subunit [Polyangiaceae bacterium]